MYIRRIKNWIFHFLLHFFVVLRYTTHSQSIASMLHTKCWIFWILSRNKFPLARKVCTIVDLIRFLPRSHQNWATKFLSWCANTISITVNEWMSRSASLRLKHDNLEYDEPHRISFMYVRSLVRWFVGSLVTSLKILIIR